MEAPTEHEVRRIAELPDRVLRNLEITHCYAQLAAATAARTGAGANWCTYATWASRQAGSTIRGEDLLAETGRRLGERRWLRHPVLSLWRAVLRRGLLRPESRLGRFAAELHTPFDAVERASDAVARGNLKVFAEIGLEFARWLACPAGDRAAFARFAEALRPGGPPDGQRLLRSAFARYQRLAGEADLKARTELAVLANLEIGLHEQTRLQPEIREALDAGAATQRDLGLLALTALFPSASRWWRGVRGPAARLAGFAAASAERAAGRLAREVVTDALMTLSLPGRVLALGTHLEDAFPEALREPADAELVAFLQGVEPQPGEPDDCGARDWSELEQRIHYIAHLFRAFHEEPALAGAPFTPAQVESFRRGTVPDGDL